MIESQDIEYARLLEQYRNKSGKTIEELASAIGVSFESYRDLELHDDEVLNCVSLKQLELLAKSLKINLRHFFSAGVDVSPEVIKPEQLADIIQRYLSEHKLSLPEFEDQAGWGVSKALSQPAEFFNYNIVALMDISNLLDIDWRLLLPPNQGCDADS
jgi:DNA-binding XRE family transcriptional regulator